MPDRLPFVLYADTPWVSPYAFSCFVVLHEKGLRFEVRTIALDRQEHLEPAYRDASLTARVPCLVDGDFWLSESLAIIEYLEESFPPPAYPALLPADLRQRARARQIMGWLRTDLLPLREERSTYTMFCERAKKPLSDAARTHAAKLVRVASAVLPEGQSSLFGPFSVADADLAFALMRLVMNGDPVPDRLRDFADSIWQRPSVRAFVARGRPSWVG